MTIHSAAQPPLRDTLLNAVARGASLLDLAEGFAGLAGDCTRPAALVDSGLVYLAVNKAYARLLSLPPSALVGKEHSRVHRNPQVLMLLQNAVVTGLAAQTPSPAAGTGAPGEAVDGCDGWAAAPLKNMSGQVLGLLLECVPDIPAAEGQAQAGAGE